MEWDLRDTSTWIHPLTPLSEEYIESQINKTGRLQVRQKSEDDRPDPQSEQPSEEEPQSLEEVTPTEQPAFIPAPEQEVGGNTHLAKHIHISF